MSLLRSSLESVITSVLFTGFLCVLLLTNTVSAQVQRWGKPWIGINAEPYVSSTLKGVLLLDVPYGPAFKAGLEPGDIIFRFQGKPIETIDELIYELDLIPVGQAVLVSVDREGHRFERQLVIGDWFKDTEQPMRLTFQPSTPSQLAQFGHDTALQGILIDDVPEDSWAFSFGFRLGDLVTFVNGEPVARRFDFVTAFKSTELMENRTLEMTLLRGGDTYALSIELPEVVAIINPSEFQQGYVQQVLFPTVMPGYQATPPAEAPSEVTAWAASEWVFETSETSAQLSTILDEVKISFVCSKPLMTKFVKIQLGAVNNFETIDLLSLGFENQSGTGDATLAEVDVIFGRTTLLSSIVADNLNAYSDGGSPNQHKYITLFDAVQNSELRKFEVPNIDPTQFVTFLDECRT